MGKEESHFWELEFKIVRAGTSLIQSLSVHVGSRLLVGQDSSPRCCIPGQTAHPQNTHQSGENCLSFTINHRHSSPIIHNMCMFVSDSISASLLQGFHVDTLTMDLVSPLHEACLGGHYACAMFLLENGANVRTFQAYFHSMCKVFGIKSLCCAEYTT